MILGIGIKKSPFKIKIPLSDESHWED